MTTKPPVDMTKGVYRKVYAGYLWGERISSVTLMVEAWFWRLHAIADDFGNLSGDPARMATEAGGRRRISPKQAQSMTDDLLAVGLVTRYETDGAKYIHIVGFEDRQPANRNGSRIQRHPKHPPETIPQTAQTPEPGIRVNPGESGGIRPHRADPRPPNPIPIPNPIPSPTTGGPIESSKTDRTPKGLNASESFKADRLHRTGGLPGFDAACDAYPRGCIGGVPKARDAWIEMGLEEDADSVVAGIERWKPTRKWTDKGGQFVPKLVNFLADRLWEEYPPPEVGEDGNPKPVRKVDPHAADRALAAKWYLSLTDEQKREASGVVNYETWAGAARHGMVSDPILASWRASKSQEAVQ